MSKHGAVGPNAVLHHARQAGGDGVRADGGCDDHIQLLGLYAAVLQGAPGRLHAHVGGGLCGADMALLHAHPFCDPFVRGLYHVGKVFVCQNLFRSKAARAQNLKAHVLFSRSKTCFSAKPAPPCSGAFTSVCLTIIFYKKQADLSINPAPGPCFFRKGPSPPPDAPPGCGKGPFWGKGPSFTATARPVTPPCRR